MINKKDHILKILTINHHEAYLSSLASLDYEFEVIVNYKGLSLPWNKLSHPVPNNIKLINFDDQVQAKLKNSYYDYVLCHTLKNLFWFFPYYQNKFIFIAHIPLFFNTPSSCLKSLLKKICFHFFDITHQNRFVAVSEFKRKKWGVKKSEVVVLTAEDLGQHKDQLGFDSIVTVCNNLKGRKEELGFQLIDDLAKNYPIKVVGKNPGLDYAYAPSSRIDFLNQIQNSRIYLYTIQQPFGDGYNTAMLEAMRMGKAIVTIANPSSPIQHGSNGFIAHTKEEIKMYLSLLLDNRDLVQSLGDKAKETFTKEFSKQKFHNSWKRIFENSI